MSTSLSKLVINLSQIYCKKCRDKNWWGLYTCSKNIWRIWITKHIHTQKIFEEFELKNLGKYHDLYVQSNTLLLADVFEKLRNKCIKIYELDSAHFLSAPGLA